MSNEQGIMKTINLKVDRVLFLVIVVLVVTGSIVKNVSQTRKYLSKRNFRKNPIEQVLNLRGYGTQMLLGDLLYEFYPHDTNVLFFVDYRENKEKMGLYRKFYERYRISPARLYFHMYPLSIELSDYDCFLEKEEFDFLVGISNYSRKRKNKNFMSYYFVERKGSEVGLFFYKDNIVVAPVEWRDVKGMED